MTVIKTVAFLLTTGGFPSMANMLEDFYLKNGRWVKKRRTKGPRARCTRCGDLHLKYSYIWYGTEDHLLCRRCASTPKGIN